MRGHGPHELAGERDRVTVVQLRGIFEVLDVTARASVRRCRPSAEVMVPFPVALALHMHATRSAASVMACIGW